MVADLIFVNQHIEGLGMDELYNIKIDFRHITDKDLNFYKLAYVITSVIVV